MRRLIVLVFLLSSYFVEGQVKNPVISSNRTVEDAMKQSSSEGKLLFIYLGLIVNQCVQIKLVNSWIAQNV